MARKRHILRNILIVIGVLFLAFIALAIFAPEEYRNKPPLAKTDETLDVSSTHFQDASYEPIDPARTDIDPTKIHVDSISVETGHIANVKRFTYNVVISQRLNKPELEKIAQEIYKRAQKENPFNALTVGFYDYPQFIGNGWRFGYADFAPNGKMEDAIKTKTGDYSTIKMNNHIIEPKWENAITTNEAEMIKYFFDVSQPLEANATTGEELDAAEKTAIQETAIKYNTTEDAVDSLLMKYNLGY